MEPYKTIKIFRGKLYDEVWAEPMTSLAVKYGISDVGLRKICKKMQIPLPPQGYHLRKSKQQKQPLKVCSEVPQEYNIHISIPGPTKIQSEDFIPEVAFEKRTENRIRVPAKLVRPHHITLLVSRAMEKQEPDSYGRIGLQAVSISPSSTTRVLRLIDAFIKALEKRPSLRVLQRENTRDIQIEVLGERISIQFFEQAKRKIHEPTSEEQKRKEWWPIPKYDFFPSGELEVRAVRTYPEVLFRENGRRRLEDNLNQVVIRLIEFVLREKENRLQKEKDFEERRLAEEKRKDLFEAIQLEKRRVHDLEVEAENWQRATKIRAYIEAVKNMAKEDPKSDSLTTWFSWAQQQADRLDPLMESPPSILDEEEATQKHK
jgi:hypothetical protein